MSANPTIRDVAREAGVSAATASLALRNDKRLLPATCAKVQRAAEKLGYRANAAASQFFAELRRNRIQKFQAALGVINASESASILTQIPTFREWERGYRERATQLGYSIDDFWLHEKE